MSSGATCSAGRQKKLWGRCWEGVVAMRVALGEGCGELFTINGHSFYPVRCRYLLYNARLSLSPMLLRVIRMKGFLVSWLQMWADLVIQKGGSI
jgi:hypothetical protein